MAEKKIVNKSVAKPSRKVSKAIDKTRAKGKVTTKKSQTKPFKNSELTKHINKLFEN